MKILVNNAGSSSLKYQLIDMDDKSVIAKGICERIGIDGGIVSHYTIDGKKKQVFIDMHNHKDAFIQVKNLLMDKEFGVMKDLKEISAVGHRVVQGGALFRESILINDEVIKGIESLIPLAPLHNKAHLEGIKACIEVFSRSMPQVAVFDTAFHSSMPQKAYIYPVPYKYYEKYKIRRYGFHGTSHRYVSSRCADLMKKNIKDLKLITCHLGNGSSIAAIDKGKVIDTSMGLTPLDGFMMGTRSGALDPSVVTFIAEKENMSIDEMNDMLNKESGFLGVSGVSSDDRDITKAVNEGNKRAMLTHEIFQYQVTKFIGGYIAALNGCDAIVFTAGLGENQPIHRKAIANNLSYFGIKIDDTKNESFIKGKEGKISTPDSKIDIYVIPTNEELVIAEDTQKIVENIL